MASPFCRPASRNRRRSLQERRDAHWVKRHGFNPKTDRLLPWMSPVTAGWTIVKHDTPGPIGFPLSDEELDELAKLVRQTMEPRIGEVRDEWVKSFPMTAL